MWAFVIYQVTAYKREPVSSRVLYAHKDLKTGWQLLTELLPVPCVHCAEYFTEMISLTLHNTHESIFVSTS